MLLASPFFGGTPIVHHVGRVGRWQTGAAAAPDPLDMAWRLAGAVLGPERQSQRAPAAPRGDDAPTRG